MATQSKIDFARFNAEARYVIVNAEAQAQSVGSNIVCPEHILLALVSKRNLTSARMLSAWGIDLNNAKEVVQEIFFPARAGKHCAIRVSEAAKDVLEQSVNQADALGSSEVSSEHLLLALLATTTHDVAALLQNYGVTQIGLLGTMADVGKTIRTPQVERQVAVNPNPMKTGNYSGSDWDIYEFDEDYGDSPDGSEAIPAAQVDIFDPTPLESKQEPYKPRRSRRELREAQPSVGVLEKPDTSTEIEFDFDMDEEAMVASQEDFLEDDWSLSSPNPVAFEEILFSSIPQEDLRNAPQKIRRRKRKFASQTIIAAVCLVLGVVVGASLLMGFIPLPVGDNVRATTQYLPQSQNNLATSAASTTGKNLSTVNGLTHSDQFDFGHIDYKPENATGVISAVAQSLPGPGGEAAVTFDLALDNGLGIDGAATGKVIHQILNDSRSWAKEGYTVAEVPSGAQLHIFILPNNMVADKCHRDGLNQDGGCVEGRNIYLSAQRWAQGDESFIKRGGTIEEYRIYLLNRQVGMVLGKGVSECTEAGRIAPVMQPQTESLSPCKANGWPYPAN